VNNAINKAKIGRRWGFKAISDFFRFRMSGKSFFSFFSRTDGSNALSFLFSRVMQVTLEICPSNKGWHLPVLFGYGACIQKID
jgi:hypothetical protein